MQSTSKLEAEMNRLLAEYRVAPVSLAQGQPATIEFDGVPVTFNLRPGVVDLLWLHVDLGAVDGEDLKAAQYLASLGFETWASNIFTVAYSPERRRAFAFTALEASGVSSETLEARLLDYVTLAKAIKTVLETGAYPGTAQESRDLPHSLTHHMLRI